MPGYKFAKLLFMPFAVTSKRDKQRPVATLFSANHFILAPLPAAASLPNKGFRESEYHLMLEYGRAMWSFAV